ncbi:MAG TPA: N-acetylglucosamine-6-phosphate deacetylase [Actinomycetota bacterium]|nr:N-acetylglucosamine-6-phosphate deacetylase [Actinomycetota bacterium]
MSRRLGVARALVGTTLLPGDVAVDAEGAVLEVGVRPPGRGGVAVPGFVDLQVNGFAGVDFLAADAAGYREAGRALAATGVVAFLPTFVSSPVGAYEAALREVAGAGETGGARALGVHLEGPFLSPRWHGAHNPEHLRDPDPALLERLLELGPVRLVTLAPELPGGLELVRALVRRGVVVALGHTDADAPAAHAAFNAGARALTHVHNAHRRWAARDPGVAGAALARGDVTVTAIVDGVHLAPETVVQVARCAGERLALVTDAIQAAGLGPGTYALGDRTVEVRGGEARLPDGTLAGSVIAMDRAVRNLVELGVRLEEAVRAASWAPARLLGRADLGVLAPGRPAHLTVLGPDLEVRRTLVGGVEAFAA